MSEGEKGPESGRGSRIACVVGCSVAALFGLVCVFIGFRMYQIWSRQKAREPVYGYLADLVGNKGSCETAAAAVKRAGLPPAEQAEGRRLYEEAAVEQGVVIAYLQSSLRLFTEQTAKEGKGKTDKALEKGEKFVKWANEKTKPVAGSADVADPTKLFPVVAWYEEEENKAIKELNDALEKCRFGSWDNIGAKGDLAP